MGKSAFQKNCEKKCEEKKEKNNIYQKKSKTEDITYERAFFTKNIALPIIFKIAPWEPL